jgi:hypothetical protein
MTMTSVGIAFAIIVWAALILAWSLCRISARSDRRIERMEFPPQAAAGDSRPLGSPVAAPLVPYTRAEDYAPLLDAVDRRPVHWATYTDRSHDGVSDALNVLADLACVPLDDKDTAA